MVSMAVEMGAARPQVGGLVLEGTLSLYTASLMLPEGPGSQLSKCIPKLAKEKQASL